jgi:hypothetical protein
MSLVCSCNERLYLYALPVTQAGEERGNMAKIQAVSDRK